MEVLLLLLVIILLIVLIGFKNNVNQKLATLEEEVKRLHTSISDARIKPDFPAAPVSIEKPLSTVTEAPKPAEEKYWETGFKVIEDNNTADLEEQLNKWNPVIEEQHKPVFPIAHTQATSTSSTPLPNETPARPAKPSFSERHPDLEKFIGENLVSKIGIGILVLAIGYFVKFAIDNNWIGEIGRVAIGILCGAILVVLAHKMRDSYKAFSSVLTGGGLAVFYFTIALAYHQFHLFGQTTAFVIMLVITAFAVSLSMMYDRQEVAIIALVGGFASPFIVSDGSGNYQTLFIYLILLNAGLLVLAYNKAWRLLNLLAFIFTVILVGGWLFSLPINEAGGTYRNGFIFLTIFYLLFFAINIAHNIKENKKFIASDFGILLANTSLYFTACLFCLYKMEATGYRGLFSALMGVFNLGASYLLFRNRKVDTNILYLLIGITLTFVSLTAPLQLDGNFITLFWASECVLLYWLYQKSKLNIIEISSVIVWLCMIISLLMDWVNIYRDIASPLPIVFNKGFITSLYASAATYAMFFLRNKDYQSVSGNHSLLLPSRTILRSVALSLLFIGGLLEINHQFVYYYRATQINLLYIELYVFAFILILQLITEVRPSLSLPYGLQMLLLAACVFLYLVMINTNFDLQVAALTSSVNKGLFTAGHTVVMLLMALVTYRWIHLFRQHKTTSSFFSTLFAWTTCTIIIIYVSVELNLHIRMMFYSSGNPLEELQRVYVKTVLPILWGLCSFVFMWLGMKHKDRSLRIISLTLFSITLLKLFMFDIRNIPVAGKIAAFFCLGVLLLVVSFMYQRLKKIIIEDEKNAAP